MNALERISAARKNLSQNSEAETIKASQPSALSRIATARQTLKTATETAPKSINTVFSRSGENRDEFDSGVRSSYAKRAASALTIPSVLVPALTAGTNNGSVLNATKTKTVAVGGGRDGIDTKEVQVPTAMSRIANVLTGAAKDWEGSNVNAAGMAVKGAQELNTLASGTAQKVQAAKDNIARYQQEIQTQRRNGTLTNESLSHLNQLISANNRAIQADTGNLEAQNSGTESGAQALNQTADKLQASGQQNVSTAKQGLGSVGSALVDIGVAGTQMAADAGAAALTGSSALVPMFIRSFGGGAQQARQAGASTGTQALYGLGSGVIETATEKISNVAAPFRKMFGAGVLDSAVQKVIGKLAQDSVGKALLTAGASAVGEGFEEFVGDLVYPVLQRATFNKDAKFNLGDSLYDAMIGGALGLIGGAPAVISSVDSKISDAVDAKIQNRQQAAERGTAETTQQSAQPDNVQTSEITPTVAERGSTVEFNRDNDIRSNAPTSMQSDIVSEIIAGKKRINQDFLSNQDFDRAAVSGAAIDAKGNVYAPKADEHIDNRSMDNVGSRSVNAFQFDHPELHEYFQNSTKDLLLDAQASIDTPATRRTERTMQGKRSIREITESPSLRAAMDDAGLTRQSVVTAADALIKDHGQENYAAAKRLELVLDDMLTNGYTTVYGNTVGPNENYIKAKSEITGSNPAQHESFIPDELDAVPEDKKTATTSGSGNRGETVQVVENLRNSIASLSEMEPVVSVTSNIYQSVKGTTMAEKARSLFESIKGIVNRPGFGDVEINSRSVKDDLSHGVGPAKASVIQAIPEVIAKGKQIDFQEKWKGRPYDGYVFAAPVEMDEKTAYVAAVVKRTSKNRLYLHEVVNADGNIIKIDNGDGANQTSLAANGDAGTQSLLSNDNVTQSGEKINGKNVDTPGDAPKGFDPFSGLQGEQEPSQMHPVNEQASERTQEERRRAPSDIPKTNLDGRLTSKHASTLANTPVTTNEMSAAIEKELANGNFSRIAYTDDAAAKKSESHVERIGWDAAWAEYKADVKEGKTSKDIVALGQTLYNNAVNSEDVMGAMDIASLMVENARETAQALQAMNMINKATPESRLYMVAQSVENLQDKLTEKYGDKAPDIKVDKDLLIAWRDAMQNGDKDTQAEAWHAVEQNIADQIPSTWIDKLNAWRYLTMLGNPRTHIRNIAGNAGFAPVRMVKDAVAAGIESAVGIEGRTKSIINPTDAADRSLIQFGWGDYNNVVDQIQSGGKFNDTSSEIDNMRTIFGFKPLETVRKFNTKALDVEDTWFSRPAYSGALAGWMKANGFSATDIQSGSVSEQSMTEARAYAIKEAQKATYRDSNDFSDFVARLGRNYSGKSKTAKAVNVLTEGVLPFKRTPANILVRAVEYSPVGLSKGIYDMATSVKSGKMTAAEAIDEFSSGLTGTGLLALGLFMASQGIASGSADDDDKQKNFDKLRGGQDYALTIGNKNYTIDWLAPEALPFFVGVEVHNFLSDSDGYTPNEAWKSLQNLTEPILETSMLSSLEDILSNLKYADGDYLGTIASTAVTSYLSQFLPTISGQAERSFAEGDRQETFRYGDTTTLGTDASYGIGKALNKIPGIDYGQIPYIDAWGRTQDQGSIVSRIVNNFLNPSYVSEDRSEPVDNELQRLYDAGFSGVLPERAAQSTKIGGEYMTSDEYVKYNRTKGQKTLSLVSDFINSETYKNLTDKERAAVVQDIYTYAADRAKKSVLDGRGEEYESDWDSEASLKDLPNYLAVKDTFSSASKARDYQTIDGLISTYDNLSQDSKDVIDGSFGRLDQIADASKSGIDSEQWYAAYDVWKDFYDTKKDGYGATDKATDFAAWVDKTNLTQSQKDLLKEQMSYSTGYKVSADKYESLTDAGLSSDAAVDVYDAISALVPESGKSTVSTKQKYAAVANMDDLSDGQKLLAMLGLDTDSDSTYERYNAASKAGIPLTDWTAFTGKLDSSITQVELKSAIGTMPWSRSQKAAAWKIYAEAKHWKAANPW